MIKKYYVNKNSNTTGEHEVHNEECKVLPNDYNRIDLGYHFNSNDALIKAKTLYNNVEPSFEDAKEVTLLMSYSGKDTNNLEQEIYLFKF